MDELSLIRKCSSGDRSAWDILIKEYSHIVKNAVKAKLSRSPGKTSAREVDDLTQEIFLHMWSGNRIEQVRKPSSLKGWLVISSMNFTASKLRTAKMRDENLKVSIEENTAREDMPARRPLKELLAGPSRGPSDTLIRNETRALVKKTISELPPKQGLALTIFLFDGCTQRKIARIMNIPEGTVAAMIKRAKDKIIAKLKKI